MDIKMKWGKYIGLINKWLTALPVGLLPMLAFLPIVAALPIINDPLGDHTASPGNPVVDIGVVEFLGNANEVTIMVSFSPDTDMSQVVGVIDLDTDQDRSTGLLPMVGNQNIGADFFLDLFPLGTGSPLNVYDSGYNIVGTVPASIVGQSLEITVPLSLLGNDDGNMDVGLALGNHQEPTDDAPNVSPFILRLNGQNFRTGDTITLASAVVPTLPQMSVDIYVALALPGGALLFLQENGRFSFDLAPFLNDFAVPRFDRQIFQYIFTGIEPPGSFSWLGAFTEPGTLNIIRGISQAAFTFSR